MQDELRCGKIEAPKFDRFPNCEETEQELLNYGKHARNLDEYLTEKFPNRSSGDTKLYEQW